MLCSHSFLPRVLQGNSTADVFLGTENCFKNSAPKPEIKPELPRTDPISPTVSIFTGLREEPGGIPAYFIMLHHVLNPNVEDKRRFWRIFQPVLVYTVALKTRIAAQIGT